MREAVMVLLSVLLIYSFAEPITLTFAGEPTYVVVCWGPHFGWEGVWEAHLVFFDEDWEDETIFFTFKSGVRQPQLSPDGQILLFVAQDDHAGAEIYLVSVADGNYLNFPNSEADDINPCFSPGGERIYFASDREGNFDIYCWDIAENVLDNLTNSPEEEIAPKVHPTGDLVLFSRYIDGCWGLVALLPDEYYETVLTTPEMGNCTHAVFSLDGNQLAFEGPAEYGTDIYVGDFQAGRALWVTSFEGDLLVTEPSVLNEIRPLDTTYGRDLYPCFSPDGETVYFGSNREGEWRIYGVPFEGGVAEPVLEVDRDNCRGLYMPAGR